MPVVNGKGVDPILRDEWPPISEAMAILETDLSHTGQPPCPHAPITLWITGQSPAVFAEIREIAPDWSVMWRPGEITGFVNVVGDTQEDALRHLAAIMKSVRIGGVRPCRGQA